ncbi:hypothetical protein [Pseudaquabacterium pictum]|uniref:Polysaccharide biosynthesis protein C-terminal domain-containing protein n=1 Tax=Pseudaquabacterium pictum TaxID=2315236 RepID=A0A480ATR0_9BURK|nr:hypothetical protein [Rubrivivax pictus]GCL63492.1 hypothetical protein AQPW35_25730 [Rubrivivax pictus]
MKPGFLRRIAQGGGLSAVKLFTGLVKIKVLASVLGVEGVGLLSLGLQFQATAVGLVSMSLAVGVINLGRPAWVDGDAAAAGQVLGTALALVGLNATVFLAALALFGQALGGGWLAAFAAQGISLWPLALAAVVVSFANVLWEGLSFLVDRFDVYVRSNMVAAVCDALLFGLGAWFFGLPGALAASLLGSLVLFAVYTLFSARATATRQILGRLSVQRARIRPLLSYSVLMLSTTALGLSCLFAARAHLTAVAGESANGYLQVVTALSAYLLPFVMTGVWGHLHPAAAASGDTTAARVELHRTLVASMRLGCAGCVAVVISAPLLVSLVYTRSFLDAQAFIPVYFGADLGYMFVSVLGAYLLAVGQKRAYFIGYAAYHGLLLAGVLLAAARWGAWAYVLAHALAAVGVTALALVHALRSGLLDGTTLRTVAGCALAALACCALDHLGTVLPLGTLAPQVSWLLGPVVILLVLAPLRPRWLPRWGRA